MEARLPAQIDLRFCPTVDSISSVRRFLIDFLQPMLRDQDAVSRVGLAAHELLENVLKYSADGDGAMQITVTEGAAGRELTLRTTNRVDEELRLGLAEAFAEMATATDAFAHYQRVIQRARHRRHGSGLGLARIWAEAEMPISCAFDGDKVEIVAVAGVDAREAA